MKIDKVLLKKFYHGECKEDESGKVYEWLSDPAHEEEATAMLSTDWDETQSDKPVVPVDLDGLLANIKSKMGGSGWPADHMATGSPAPHEDTSAKNGGTRSFALYKFAAGFVSVAVISGLLYKLFLEDKYFIYSTGYGEVKAVTLPDGSHVTLNANSTIKYTYNYDESSESNDAPREVFLDGEGFFNIEKKPAAGTPGVRFIVHTNHVDVEVLGTTFNVNTRRNKTMIVLTSGQVRLGIGNSGNWVEQMMMHPGELVEVDYAEKDVVKRTVDVNAYTSWRKNELIFQGTPVKDVLDIIENNFGYDVVLHDKSLESRLYTDTTPANNLDLLLAKLSIVYSLKVTRTDTQIIIQAK
jgi:transmembrane sensor